MRHSILVLILVLITIPIYSQAPGDARRGGVVMREGGCLECHGFQGAGKATASDLSKPSTEIFTRTRLASAIWNHAPAMFTQFQHDGRPVPSLTDQSVADMFTYFYAARFFDPVGDAARGKQLFEARRCASCHDIDAKKVGPPISQWKEVDDPAAWIRQMWNHSGAMYAKAKEKKIEWPILTGPEFSDLMAYFKSLPQARSGPARFATSDPELGRALFDKKKCTTCHVIKGTAPGKISIPIDGRPADTLSAVAADMWNHAPRMNASSRGDLPQFVGAEMNHVIAYLFWAGFFEDPGDSRAGQRVYQRKQCGECHDTNGAPSGGLRLDVAGAPDLAFIRSRPGNVSAITLTGALWKHGPKMYDALKKNGRDWPRFEGAEMADLIAYLNKK